MPLGGLCCCQFWWEILAHTSAEQQMRICDARLLLAVPNVVIDVFGVPTISHLAEGNCGHSADQMVVSYYSRIPNCSMQIACR